MTERSWWDRAVDTVLSVVSPRRRMLREHRRLMEGDDEYRRAFDLAARMRGYKAASHSKNHTPWDRASPRSADAEILGDLYTMRNRSRAANRDDALSSGITKTFVRGVVGTGLRPQATTSDDAKNHALVEVWKSRKDQLSRGEGDLLHGAVQAMRFSKRIEDGEILLRPACAAPGEPIWIENIEADRLHTPADALPEDPEGRIVYGVEKDRFARVAAYWILKKHPGDTVLWETKLGTQAVPFVSTFAKEYFDRVPADSVCHIRSSVTRPGQSHGVPQCHAVLQDLRDLDLLLLASLKRTQIAACLAVFLTSTSSTTDLLQLTAEEYGYQLEEKIEPGMIFRLFPGEQVQFLNPATGVPDLDKFVFLLARRIGSAIGLSPQAILRAWEGLSYSTARTVKIDDRTTFRIERFDFAEHALSWEWRVVLEDELVRGNEVLLEAGVTVEDLDKVTWIGDEEPWVDPLAEAQSTELMLELGLTSPQIECARLGREFRAVLRDRLQAEKDEIEERRKLGLPPRATSAAAVAVGDADASGDESGAAGEEDAAASRERWRSREIVKLLRYVKRLDQRFAAAESRPVTPVVHNWNVQPTPVVRQVLNVPRGKTVVRAENHYHAPELPAPTVHNHNRVDVTPHVTADVNLPERKTTLLRGPNGELSGAISRSQEN